MDRHLEPTVHLKCRFQLMCEMWEVKNWAIDGKLLEVVVTFFLLMLLTSRAQNQMGDDHENDHGNWQGISMASPGLLREKDHTRV